MNNIKNKDIKEYAKKSGVKLWQVAEKFGLNDGNMSRKLRKEFSEKEKENIIKIIDLIKVEEKK